MCFHLLILIGLRESKCFAEAHKENQAQVSTKIQNLIPNLWAILATS